MVEGHTYIEGIVGAVVEGDSEQVRAAVANALDQGLDPRHILDAGLTAAMNLVGARLDAGEIFIPDVLWSAEAMHEGLALLLPLLAPDEKRGAGKVVIGTVEGDIHDIGKNLVGLMLSGAGFEVLDLGSDVSPLEFVEAVVRSGAQIVAMSAMLTTTMPVMSRTLALLEDRGLRGSVEVLVGGAPVTQNHADSIGADGWAIDAPKAIIVAREMVV